MALLGREAGHNQSGGAGSSRLCLVGGILRAEDSFKRKQVRQPCSLSNTTGHYHTEAKNESWVDGDEP